MNYKYIRFILGAVLIICGMLMVLPCIVAVIYREREGLSLLISCAICLLIGFLCFNKKPTRTNIYTKDSLIAVALSWITLGLFGALPFFISGAIPNYIDALFETVSGFTTTGSSILQSVEDMPKCLLFWRSFTHWIGGMGILVFMLALLPMTGGYQMNLMKAESPGPKVGKLVPKVQSTAKMLYFIYIVMTVLQIVLLIIARMPVFDAVTIAFGSAGTGGFGVRNDSCGSYSSLQQMIIAVFILAFGVNFNVYFLILRGKISDALSSEEVRGYFTIVLGSVAIITLSLIFKDKDPVYALRDSFFTVASIITTTGFGTADFDKWPQIARTLLVCIMFVGACAGSTGGGMKVSRIMIMFKTVKKEIRHFLYSKNIEKIRFEKKIVEHEVIRSINVFVMAYLFIYVTSFLLISLDGKDFTTNFTAVAATINNIGPGLGEVGATGNFSSYSWLSKLVLIFDMLAGRLELFPILMLFVPKAWKKF
ncbi:MAG: TrkH family potassium uptake protein [Lachnospiraceae bacterium]|nr:TrkH family potassium uptake protein [Lachnospiraceae bacterium]